jgi:hypothetical protein
MPPLCNKFYQLDYTRYVKKVVCQLLPIVIHKKMHFANIFTTFYKFLSFYRKARIYHSHFEDKDNVIIMSSLKKWF